LGLATRAGLHTGEIEQSVGQIGGIAVHIGARVAAVAEADETLVSSTVMDLVVGSAIAFADRGPHTLKGVPEEWRLYAASSSSPSASPARLLIDQRKAMIRNIPDAAHI